MLRVRIFAEGGFFMQRRMHMLQIKSLSIYHKKDLHALLKDFSFVLKDGEKVALIGEGDVVLGLLPQGFQRFSP